MAEPWVKWVCACYERYYLYFPVGLWYETLSQQMGVLFKLLFMGGGGEASSPGWKLIYAFMFSIRILMRDLHTVQLQQ